MGVVVTLALGACSSGSSAASGPAPVRARYALPAGTSSADAEMVGRRMEARFRALGVSDVDVAVQGDTVVVRGERDAGGLAARVGEQGILEFRPVAEVAPPGTRSGEIPAPDGTVVVTGRDGTRYAVEPPAITGGVVSAKASYIPGGAGYVVNLSFDPDAAKEFDSLARRSIGQRPPRNSVAIVIDDRVVSAPAFQARTFPDGVQISGGFTRREAEALAVALNSGPYPVKVRLQTPTSSG